MGAFVGFRAISETSRYNSIVKYVIYFGVKSGSLKAATNYRNHLVFKHKSPHSRAAFAANARHFLQCYLDDGFCAPDAARMSISCTVMRPGSLIFDPALALPLARFSTRYSLFPFKVRTLSVTTATMQLLPKLVPPTGRRLSGGIIAARAVEANS